MASPRQQRARRDARFVSSSLPSRVADLCLAPANAAAKTLTISLSNFPYPPNNNGQVARVILEGVPQILRLADMTYPVSATLSAGQTQLNVTYSGANIADNELFQVGAQDPAVRDAYGAYMAQSNLRWHND